MGIGAVIFGGEKRGDKLGSDCIRRLLVCLSLGLCHCSMHKGRRCAAVNPFPVLPLTFVGPLGLHPSLRAVPLVCACGEVTYTNSSCVKNNQIVIVACSLAGKAVMWVRAVQVLPTSLAQLKGSRALFLLHAHLWVLSLGLCCPDPGQGRPGHSPSFQQQSLHDCQSLWLQLFSWFYAHQTVFSSRL